MNGDVELPEVTGEERELIHYNPNTGDIIDWADARVRAAVLADRERRAQTAPVAEEWQPIETAPRDGTWVLAINAETNPGRQHVVRYADHRGTKYPWETDSAPMSFVAGLTHWQTLPAPPAHSAGKGEA